MEKSTSGAIPRITEIDVLWRALQNKPASETAFAPADSRQLDHFSSLSQCNSTGEKIN